MQKGCKIRFILGPSGAGKTELILSEVRSELAERPLGPPVLLLVPEQATLQTEQALLGTDRLRGTIRCEILSFRRLAYRVFQHAGRRWREPLGPVGRRLIVRQVLRKLQGKLSVLPAREDPVAVAQVTHLLCEFLRSGLSPEALRDRAQKVEDASLAAKLLDAAAVLGEYLAYESRTHRDPDTVLSDVLSAMEESDFGRQAMVWVDGFAGFSGAERRILRALARKAQTLTIALLLDRPGGEELFEPTCRTHNELLEDFKEEGLSVLPPRVLPETQAGTATVLPRFAGDRALAHLEQHLFRNAASKFAGRPDSICIRACATRRQEAQSAAAVILKLVSSRGFRFRDIAIVVRDLAQWHDLIAASLAEHEIPYFVDMRRSLAQHPLAELVRSLGDLLESDFAGEVVARFVKTGLAGLSPEEADILENGILRFGLRGADWWARSLPASPSQSLKAEDTPRPKQDDSAVLEKLRERVGEKLKRWSELSEGALSAAEWAGRLYRFVDELGALGTLEVWAREAQAEGDLQSAQQHRRAAVHFSRMLDEVADAAGGEVLTAGAFFRLLSAGLSAWDIGVTPPSCDQVLVGAVERSRHPSLKAVLVLGLNEGSFPVKFPQDGLLSDYEREMLRTSGIPVGETTGERIAAERLLAYIAFTRASRLLYLSYSETDEEGRPLAPSVFLREVQELFPDLQTERPEDPLLFATTPERVAEGLLEARRNPAKARELPRWERLAEALKCDAEAAGRLEEALRAGGRPQRIDHVGRILPAPSTVSVTELEAFAKCPMWHFVRYRLGLEEREVFTLGRLDLGRLRHRLLEELGKRLISEGKAIWQYPEEERDRLIEEADLAVKSRGFQTVCLRDKLCAYLADRVKEEIRRFLPHRALIEKAGRWVPWKVEFAFGPGRAGEPLRIDTSSGRCLITGIIDRIDRTVEPDGSALYLIYDFKVRSSYSLAAIYHGISLQLPLYLAALRAQGRELLGERAFVGGALLQATVPPVKVQEVAGSAGDDVPERRIPTELKPRGPLGLRALKQADPKLFEKGGWSPYFSAFLTKKGELGSRDKADALEDFELQAVIDFALSKTKMLIESMASGTVSVSPVSFNRRTPCATCPFSAVCRFERVIERNRIRKLQKFQNLEVLELISASPAARSDPTPESRPGPGGEEEQ